MNWNLFPFHLVVVAIAIVGSSDLEPFCPRYITCSSEVKQDSCAPGTFYQENVKIGGCCPDCVTLKGEGEPCQASAECQPGLRCGLTQVCAFDQNQACEYYKHTNPIWNKNKYWTPVCLLDGSFAPKQCKGEQMSGKCFCSDRYGNRIFGEEEWSKAADMNCACSRLVDELKKIRTQVSFHCDPSGNFEPLQCDQNVCWCASPKSGFPYSMVVPSEMMRILPCYNKNQVGLQYYRKCDSERHAQEKIKFLLQTHGTKEVTLLMPNCNFDGSYHRVQRVKDKSHCVFINNSPLTEAVALLGANCNCAYDRHVVQQLQNPFLFDCQPNGNYAVRQILEEKTYCVDSDGFVYSNDSNDCPRSNDPQPNLHHNE